MTVHTIHRVQLDVTQRPRPDGTVPASTHVPFYLALEMMFEAWRRVLATTCQDILEPRDLGVVNVTSDFGRELHVGATAFDVDLERVGTSSITFRIDVGQNGQHAATIRTTLAQVNDDRTRSVPLSPLQRAALELLQ